MGRTSAAPRRASWARYAWAATAALVVAVVAVVALWLVGPARGVDTEPPQCWAEPGWTVPCGTGLGGGVAAGAAVLAALVVLLVTRPRGTHAGAR